MRVQLDRDLLVKCWRTAKARDAIKLAHTDRRVSGRPGWEIHFDGLRTEAAFAQCIRRPELVSWSVQLTGDGGIDLKIGKSIQLKASIYDPPYLRFDPTGSQCFSADIAVLARVPLFRNEPDWPLHSGWVEFAGWLTREAFMERADVRNFGYGDRLVVEPEMLWGMPTLLQQLLPRPTCSCGRPDLFCGAASRPPRCTEL